MQFLNTIFYTGIYISLAALALGSGTFVSIHHRWPPWPFMLLLFSGTLLVYTLHYFLKRSPTGNTRNQWSYHHPRWHQILIILGGAGCLASIIFIPNSYQSIISLEAIITLSYFLLFTMSKWGLGSRLTGLLKTPLLAAAWTIATFNLFMVEASIPSQQIILWTLQRFIFLLALCLAFDIRDHIEDKKNGITTWPVHLGVTVSYKIITGLLLLSIIFSLLLLWQNGSLLIANALMLSIAVAAFFIQTSKRNPSDYVYLGGIDGAILLQGILLMTGGI
jgi:1,4-dihydroxy-2-naphthoate octaprenyltransferase